MKSLSIASLGTTALLVIAATAQGQARPLCWRPQPGASCSSWLINEAAVEGRIATTNRYRVQPDGQLYVASGDRARVALVIGFMKNVGARNAVGITGSALSPVEHARVEARFRHWTSSNGVDLSAGVTDDGITGAFGMSGTKFGVDVRADLFRRRDGRVIEETFIGARVGGRAFPFALVALLPVFALFTMN